MKKSEFLKLYPDAVEVDVSTAKKLESGSPQDEKHMLRKAARTLGSGATLGFLPALEGGANAIKGGLKELVEHIKKGDLMKPSSKEELDEVSERRKKEYHEGREASHKDIEEFSKENPKTALGLEVAGSIPTMMIGVGGVGKAASLGKKVAHGAKAGGMLGATESVGKSLSADEEKDALIKALKSGLAGAVAGGAVTGVASTMRKKGVEDLIEALGKERVHKAAAASESLLENADEKVMKIAEDLRGRGTAGARQAFKDLETKLESAQPDEIKKIIAEYISPEDYAEKLSQTQEAGKKIYEPLYEKAKQHGNIELSEVKDDPRLKQFISRANRYSGTKGDPNNVETLQKAYSKVGDKIAALEKSGYKSDARDLMEFRDKLRADIDKAVLEHKPAREAYHDTKKAEEAMEWGLKEFPKASPENFKELAAEIAEKHADHRRAGVAQHFKNKHFNLGSEDTNQYKQVFKSDDVKRLEALKLLSKERAQELASTVGKKQKAIDNVRAITRGGQKQVKVMENEMSRPASWLAHPYRKGIRTIDKIISGGRKRGDEHMAELITNSQKLADALRKRLSGRRRMMPAMIRTVSIHATED